MPEARIHSATSLIHIETGSPAEHPRKLRPLEKTPRTCGPIVLVSMPFGPLFTPSIALGLLTSELRNAGFEITTFYFTISFANKIGLKLYELISSGTPETSLLLGDWLFRDALFGKASPADDAAYRELLEESRRKISLQSADFRWQTEIDLRNDVAQIRQAIDEYLDECADKILAANPMLIGFTTVFQQNVASLALGRRLKARSSEAKVVFGGANCESVMGAQLLASFPQVDYVISGEGESAVVELADRISVSSSHEMNAINQATERAPLSGDTPPNLNTLGFPDYDSYFAQTNAAPDIERRVRLLFETSRGCWWGARKHCTFCGLNGMSMAFRSKSASRAIEELEWMISRYPGHPISVVDNILDMKYFDTFIPMLQNIRMNTELFYEVKANLKKRQLEQLRSANICRIQPGIESLHDGVLDIMQKGVSAIQNLQFLKWSLELGIEPLWNMLWGFPGEEPHWYSEMAALIPRLRHLPPPDSVSGIRLDRFSPLFDDIRLGALNKKPYPAYDLVYAELSPKERVGLAYHFTFAYGDGRDVSLYTSAIHEEILKWQRSFATSAFFSIDLGQQLILCDMRDPDPSAIDVTLLSEIDTRLYRLCDSATTVENVWSALHDAPITLDECAERMRSLAENGAMVEIRGKYLSLAIEMNEHVPTVNALERFQNFLQSNNLSTDDSVSQVRIKTQHHRRSEYARSDQSDNQPNAVEASAKHEDRVRHH